MKAEDVFLNLLETIQFIQTVAREAQQGRLVSLDGLGEVSGKKQDFSPANDRAYRNLLKVSKQKHGTDWYKQNMLN